MLRLILFLATTTTTTFGFPLLPAGAQRRRRRRQAAVTSLTTLNAAQEGGGSPIAAVTTTTLSPNQLALNAKPAFPRTWVPLASVLELDPDRPTPLFFLDNSYVTYCVNNHDHGWVVLDNACPHRLAPLSEGRVDPTTRELECSYHGWKFNHVGNCTRIPQATPKLEREVLKKNSCACKVHSYPVQVHKGILWAWLWSDDLSSTMPDDEAHPQHMLQGVSNNDIAGTYTRDLPYGWDTLLENIVDPSHVPFAHHGIQGSRQDALPINMSVPTNIHKYGFEFDFGDRTLGKRRQGSGYFRAPFCVTYGAAFEGTTKKPASNFNLTAVMLPTKPGWSRAIIITTTTATTSAEDENEKKKKPSLLGVLFKLLPTWLGHQFSNRFLDSDLAFLHYQEQERARRRRLLQQQNNNVTTGSRSNHQDGYFLPAPSDRCVAALRQWITTYAHIPGPLPPAIYNRNQLFDRWGQHSSHCKHCSRAATTNLVKWRRNTQWALAVSILLFRWPAARFVTVVSLALLRIYAKMEQSFRVGEFKHYENH